MKTQQLGLGLKGFPQYFPFSHRFPAIPVFIVGVHSFYKTTKRQQQWLRGPEVSAPLCHILLF